MTRDLSLKRARAPRRLVRFTAAAWPLLALMGTTHCASEGHSQRKAEDARLVPASRLDDAPELGRSNVSENELDDQQVAMVMDAFHTAMLDQARLAYPKTKDPAVKRYAQTLLADHARAKQDQTDVFVELRLSPRESPVATELGVESGKVLFALRDAKDSELDDAFLAAQVGQNQRFLELLSQKLVPNATEPRLRQLLEAQKPRVELHLEMARGLKHALDNP